jgi:hypothetical protein
VKDWTIPRRGVEPSDFGARTFCYGSGKVAARDVSSVRVRFHNTGGVPYLRAEAHVVYPTRGRDETKVTFDWADDAGPHRESRVFAAGKPAEWELRTGRNVRTRWVEFEPVAGR